MPLATLLQLQVPAPQAVVAVLGSLSTVCSKKLGPHDFFTTFYLLKKNICQSIYLLKNIWPTVVFPCLGGQADGNVIKGHGTKWPATSRIEKRFVHQNDWPTFARISMPQSFASPTMLANRKGMSHRWQHVFRIVAPPYPPPPAKKKIKRISNVN